jgi:DNA end-binding protein Ku
MAARAIWKGAIELGRAKIPVKLYSAVEDRTVHFHLLEKRTHSRVKQHMVDPDSGEEIASDQIRKGYEVERGTFVVIDAEDLKTIDPRPSQAIDVAHFLPENWIGEQYYDRPYYLGPDGDAEAYFGFAEALAGKKREGFARWVMRNKEYIGALRSQGGNLLLITLRHAEEVLSAREIGTPPGKSPDQREIKMAEQLVSSLEGDFRAEDYADDYRERVMKYLEAKAKGRRPRLETIPKPRQAPKSLADALAASLKSVAKQRKEKAVA